METIHKPPTSEEYKSGFLQACSEIKDRVSDAHQRVNDAESHKIIDWIWDEIKRIENQVTGRSPV